MSVSGDPFSLIWITLLPRLIRIDSRVKAKSKAKKTAILPAACGAKQLVHMKFSHLRQSALVASLASSSVTRPSSTDYHSPVTCN